MSVALGSSSKPTQSSVVVRASPEADAAIIRRTQPGETVIAYEMSNGWVRISSTGDTPEWVIPEMLEW
ncbi:hypothetical protein D3C85_1868580 [compost metagenome]